MTARCHYNRQCIGQRQARAARRFRHQRFRESGGFTRLPRGRGGKVAVLFDLADQSRRAGLREQAFSGIGEKGVHGKSCISVHATFLAQPQAARDDAAQNFARAAAQ